MPILRPLLVAAVGLALSAPTDAWAQTRTVAISTIIEVPALLDVRDGIIEGLAERGFERGKTLAIVYESANTNMVTQQQIAKKFAGLQPDVIVPITTPTAQAMVAATSDVPIVFAAVTDPVKAKLVPQLTAPGGRVTGVSDAAPIRQQVELIRAILPTLAKLGFIYNPGLDNAVAALEQTRAAASPLGIEIVESPAPTSNEVLVASRKLVGRVDAIYVPNDSTVVSALEAVVKTSQDARLPLFVGETQRVEKGAIASVGFNYKDGGRIAGHMVADILEGKQPGTIDVVVMRDAVDSFDVVVNRKAATAIGLALPEAVIAGATRILD